MLIVIALFCYSNGIPVSNVSTCHANGDDFTHFKMFLATACSISMLN